MRAPTLVSAGLLAALVGAASAFEASAARLGRSAVASRPAAGHARMSTLAPQVGEMPSLDGALPDCPTTVWDSENMDIAAEQARYREEGLPTCPLEIVATPEENAEGVAYFSRNADKYRELLREHGTIWFKGFDLMKTEQGFRAFYDAIGLSPCLDPIHTSGLRAFASARDAVYEEVNKASLAGHYIGLHNEVRARTRARAQGAARRGRWAGRRV